MSFSTSSNRSGRSTFGLSTTTILLLVLTIVILSSLPSAHAFGAGNIPSYAYMEGKAFRHGDIEDILAELIKKAASGILSRSSKFDGMAIKQVYFGNWLCDYSQAMDIAGLEKLTKQTIINICMVLGFLAHGYATKEFQVTEQRLGAYLPVTHIDNPKGYGEGKDPRKVDPRLRGPIDPRELEVDPRSGMKNYIANENGNWDTSSALLRRELKRCIDVGRRARAQGNSDELYEAYRLLGQCLHTLEDYPAHSNWCEIALFKLGHRNVFQHVGDNVKVRTPDGQNVAPIVTGTFGGSDFVHSLLGEAQDHLSEASVSDLSKSVENAKSTSRGGGSDPIQDLLGLIAGIPGGGGEGVSRDAETLSRGPSSDPNQMSPEEMYKNLWRILEFRDKIMKNISATIEKIPGLNALVEKITNSLTVFVFTLLEPYIKPLMQQAMGGLHTTSTAVVSGSDQYEVFNNPNCSDPTHSILSKDHFGLILNEPAGNIAIIMVRWAVNLVVGAWDDTSKDPEQVADACLAPLFHPYWYNPRAEVQREMMEYIEGWARNHPEEIRRLDKGNVRAHTNTRTGKAAENHSCGEGGPSLAQFQGGSHSQAAQSFMPSGHHSSHVQNHANYGSGGHHSQNQNQSSYGDGSDLPKPSQQDTGFGNQMAGAAQNYISGKLGGGGGGMLGQAAGFLSRDADGYEGRQVSSQDEDQDGGYRRHQQAPQHHGAPHGSGSHGSYGRDHESSGESGEFPAMPDERRYGGGEHNAPHYPPPQEGGWQQGGPPPMPNPQFGGGGYPGSDQHQGGGYPGQQGQGYPNQNQNQGYPGQGYPNQQYGNQSQYGQGGGYGGGY